MTFWGHLFWNFGRHQPLGSTGNDRSPDPQLTTKALFIHPQALGAFLLQGAGDLGTGLLPFQVTAILADIGGQWVPMKPGSQILAAYLKGEKVMNQNQPIPKKNILDLETNTGDSLIQHLQIPKECAAKGCLMG